MMERLSLADLDPAEIAARTEEDLQLCHHDFARQSGIPFGIDERFAWVMAHPAPWPNFVYLIHFDQTAVDEQIEAAVVRIRAGQIPGQWVVGPLCRPVDLGERLMRHGFRHARDWSGMAVGLARLDESKPPPPTLEVRPVEDLNALAQWTGVVTPALWGGGEGEAREAVRSMQCLLGNPAFKLFLALDDGRPAGTAMAYLGADVAGIYCVGSRQELRGRGIGRQVTLASLVWAREQGYRTAVLQASALGAFVYRRLGFIEYCRMKIYRWSEA